MKWQRLFSMGPVEMGSRSRREFSKVMDRLAGAAKQPAPRPEPVFRHLDRTAGGGHEVVSLFERGRHRPAMKALLENFYQNAPSRFFVGISDDAVVEMIAAHCGEERARIIARAEAVCRSEFDILGYGRLFFGDPVDWHYDPVAGRSVPFMHWSKLDPLDREQVGDSKVVWELNRHQWALDLGQAFRFTGDRRYAQRFARLVRGWMLENPVGMGINWSSALEVAMRLISWSWALMLFNRHPGVSTMLFVDVMAGIREHARHVERYLSHYFSPNTHLTGEALGLFYAGTMFPEFKEARHWQALGRRILLEQFDRQVHPDGVYFEQSTCYQYYTVEIYLHFIVLAQRNGQKIPRGVSEGLMKMLDFLIAVRRPNGSVPQIGDADGGWLLPLGRRKPGDFRGLFAVAAALFQRADYAWAAEGTAPELLWFMGCAGQEALFLLNPAPPAQPQPWMFDHGGYAVMRSDWGGNAHHMIIDAGPLGGLSSAGHGHADLLSLQCSAFGDPYLVDSGTYCYTAKPCWRNYFRSSRAHSTITVDRRDQAVPAGPFAWRSPRPKAWLNACDDSGGRVLIDASHDAYRGMDDPVTHRRRVAFIRSSYWIVVDDLSGHASHRIDLRYQFAPMQVTEREDGWIKAGGHKHHCLFLRAFASADLETEIRIGGLDPVDGWVSPDYGMRVPAPTLLYKTETGLPLRIVSCLFPARGNDTSPPEVESFVQDDRISIVLKHRGSETIQISDQEIRVDTRKG